MWRHICFFNQIECNLISNLRHGCTVKVIVRLHVFFIRIFTILPSIHSLLINHLFVLFYICKHIICFLKAQSIWSHEAIVKWTFYFDCLKPLVREIGRRNLYLIRLDNPFGKNCLSDWLLGTKLSYDGSITLLYDLRLNQISVASKCRYSSISIFKRR